MITVEYLDDERAKLWAQVNELKAALSDAVAKLSQSDKATLAVVEEKSQTLNQSIAAVKVIADAKTPEDVQTASRAAQEAVQIKESVKKLADETVEAKNILGSVKKAFKQIEDRETASREKVQEIDANYTKLVEAKSSAETLLAKIGDAKCRADEAAEKVSSAVATAVPQAQEISNLKAQSSSALSEITAISDKIEEIQNELITLKDSFESSLESAKESLSGIEKEKSVKLDDLFEQNEKRLNDLGAKIEDLLPGSTAAALATAFDERKTAVEKYKWVWAVLLIVASAAIVVFGCWFLTRPEMPNAGSSLPIRLVIIAGLVMVEEFARRNFNVATRLAESYAYKEAISKSYLGFKKEMTDIGMPEKDPGHDTPCVSVLVKTFLDKLGEEPGRRVFEKERRAFGVFRALMNSTEPTKEDSPEQIKMVATTVSACSKMTWPLVALLSVLIIVAGVVICVIMK